MSATPTDLPPVFPPGPLEAERPSLDFSGLQAAVDGACRAIEKLIAQRAELRAVVEELLATRGTRKPWERAVIRAFVALKATA